MFKIFGIGIGRKAKKIEKLPNLSNYDSRRKVREAANYVGRNFGRALVKLSER